MKTKTNLIIASFMLVLGLRAQTGPAAPAVAPAPPATPAAPAAVPASPVVAPRTVEIVVNDMMSFSVTKITAHPGEQLTIRLKNEGSQPKDVMGHNWILLKAGADMNAYAMAAAADKTDDFQPKALSGQVLAAIPMLGPKQSGEVTFTCPATPGTYNYMCSCFAHSLLGMKGTLIVK